MDQDFNQAQQAEQDKSPAASPEEKDQDMGLLKETTDLQSRELFAATRYIKRIQRAIFPAEEQIRKSLPDYFILDIPRNVVSGDFCWIGENGHEKLIAVADCTGHGISGALMTMAGAAFLSDIFGRREYSGPADILCQLRERVMKLLKQEGVEEETPDGLDISLLRLDKEKPAIHYSGANSQLYLIHEGQLSVTQGDRMPIGVHLNFRESFSDHELTAGKGDLIYLFTDGYADQFGGPHNKKFRYRQFQELILSIHNLPLAEQKERLCRTIADWRGNNIQVDDMLILGFKL